ncbi:MAG: SAM-dependent methyltransferase [Bacteroidales bacterium]|nr:SAM-dependent methyltransferase [Bacteroidales bacterium]
MTQQANNIFQEKLEFTFDNQEFVKLILSKKRNKNSDLKKVTIKLSKIKEDLKLSFNYTHNTNDKTKNFEIEEGISKIQELLDTEFYNADLFTTKETIQLFTNKKNNSKIKTTEPTFTTIPNLSHDKIKKKRILLENNLYLQELGITTKNFKIKKDMHDKYRQINKYLEIIESLLDSLKEKKELKIVDMGSGKGYLTFALYDFLKNSLNLQPKISGVEFREELVKKSNQLADKAGFKNLNFKQGTIKQTEIGKIDILIALHACDTATDEAIYKGIKSNADLIIVAPCCQKQIRKQFNVQNEMASIVKHGILKEQQAVIITDGLRALILEAFGYKAKVFEFISTEHTPKNTMVVGTKHNNKIHKNEILEKINAIKDLFGIEYHHLEKLLKI